MLERHNFIILLAHFSDTCFFFSFINIKTGLLTTAKAAIKVTQSASLSPDRNKIGITFPIVYKDISKHTV